MPNLNHPNQEQNGPFGAKDREKRTFVIKKLDTNNGENTAYEVLLEEKEDGSIETTHLNRRFFSKNGYEISPTTTPLGLCSRCGDTMSLAILKTCLCGRLNCPRCRIVFEKLHYCKYKCAFLAIVKRIIKIPLQDIYKG